MLEAIPVTEARQQLLPLLDRIENGAYRFMVTRHGKPLAVVLSYEEYSRMAETLKLLEDRRLSHQLDRGLAQAQAGKLIDLSRVKAK
jgi:antitoxin YefM